MRFLLNAWRRGEEGLQGIVGMLGEMLVIPPELTKALEAALGAAAQFLVVQTPGKQRRC
ncbi:MAG TPA: hypothetical protein ENM97_02390 [Moorella mulderi]|nr:hypothetical protein [Moorella mulderi]